MQQRVGILTLPSEKGFSQSLLIYQNSSNFNEFSLCCIDMAFRINFSFQQAAGAACYLPSFVEYVPSKSTLVSEE